MGVEKTTGLYIFNDSVNPVLTRKAEIRRAYEHRTDRFVRNVWLGRDFENFDLNKLLEETDTLFERIASMAGGAVVRHTWGLLEAFGDERFRHLRDSSYAPLPSGYVLAAEVDNIKKTRDLETPEYARVNEAIQRHRSDGSTLFFWEDYGTHQFMQGTTGDAAENLWLIDIDLVLKANPTTARPATIEL